MKKRVIRCGGVPEHFNLPWQLAVESKDIEGQGVEMEWQYFPGGTGAIAQALKEKKIDVGVMLTEGAVVDIIQGGPGRILSFYMNSPMTWGVYVPGRSIMTAPGQLQGFPMAVTYFNSGSHLMGCVYADKMGWKLKPDSFMETYSINGSLIAMKLSRPRILLWDKYMAKPYVNSGELRMLDEVTTPWSSIVVVVHEDELNRDPYVYQAMMDVVREYALRLGSHEKAPELLAERYNMPLQDVQDWLDSVQWNLDGAFYPDELIKAARYMTRLGIINDNSSEDELLAKLLHPESKYA